MALTPANTGNGNGTGTTLVEFNTVLGFFVLVSDKSKITSIAACFGDSWKKGFTGSAGLTAAARAKCVEQGVFLGKAIPGKLESLRYDEGTDGRNIYRKVRVTLSDDGARYTLTLPLDGEAASRLIPKLASTAVGTTINVGIWMAMSDTKADGNRYANVGVSVKSEDIEIPSSFIVIDGLKSAENEVRVKTEGVLEGADLRSAITRAKEKSLQEFLQKLSNDAPVSAAAADASASVAATANSDDVGY